MHFNLISLAALATITIFLLTLPVDGQFCMVADGASQESGGIVREKCKKLSEEAKVRSRLPLTTLLPYITSF
jgi:sorbitol-specific phosphotransferase system component IIC